MINLFITILLSSCANNTNADKHILSQDNSSQTIVSSDTSKLDSSYVPTGFYFLADKEQGIRMHKDHSDENYNISPKPFVSVQNILRANAQKNIVQGRVTYGVTIVLDNQGTTDLAEATGNSSYPYIAIVMANRLLYVVENTSKIKTGIMQVILVDYAENEIDEMVNAIIKKK